MIQTATPDVRYLVARMAVELGKEFPAPKEEMIMRQAMSLGEEAGEAIGATRRYLGVARRSGTREDVEAELADVIFSVYLVAHYVGANLDQAILRKAEKIFSRGWKERETMQ